MLLFITIEILKSRNTMINIGIFFLSYQLKDFIRRRYFYLAKNVACARIYKMCIRELKLREEEMRIFGKFGGKIGTAESGRSQRREYLFPY